MCDSEVGIYLLLEKLRQRCKSNPQAIALPECEDTRVASCAVQLLRDGLVNKVYTCSHKSIVHQDIQNLPEELISKFEFENDAKSLEPLSIAALHLNTGTVASVLAGAKYTTANVLRCAIKEVGLAEGTKTVSGSFILEKQGSPTFMYADCGAVISPSMQQLVEIAEASVHTWKSLFDAEPVVAFLSFSTKGSAIHESANKMAEAAAIFANNHPQIRCDGELQFDAAVVPEICQRKAPGSAVAGQANIFIFPDLNSANIAYKITQRVAGYAAYGPLLQGIRLPISDLSRGATQHDIFVGALINQCRRDKSYLDRTPKLS